MSLNGKIIVKIGDSIRKKQKSNLVTFQYDFVPSTVVDNQPGEVKIDNENGICVDLPNKSGVCTQFKGSLKEAVKECVLIHNKKTGEWTLERLDYTVSLKNTRKPGKIMKPETPNNSNLSDFSDEESISKDLISDANKNQTDIFSDFSDFEKEEKQTVCQSLLDELNLTDSELEDNNERELNNEKEDMEIDIDNLVEDDLKLSDNSSDSGKSDSSSDSDSEPVSGADDDQSYISN